MSEGREHSVTLQLPTAASIEALHRKLDDLVARIEKGAGSQDDGAYIEPGPGSPRQYFTAKEPMERWNLSKTSVYETPEFELPRLKKNGWIRYHWAHVWAYEGRISREKADEYFHGSVSETKEQLLSNPSSRLARLRQLRPGQLQGSK